MTAKRTVERYGGQLEWQNRGVERPDGDVTGGVGVCQILINSADH
jgi:hypothetical protein